MKSRIALMLGFKIFEDAAMTIGAVELLHRVRNGQFNPGQLRTAGRDVPAIWNAMPSA